ncbi:MAG: PKD domain-containing protein [Opitutales bacterium]|nr:PKD domain-containing protein [Opitutales bacterium]
MMFRLPVNRVFLAFAGWLAAFAPLSARPPLLLLDEARLNEIRHLVTVPGTTHFEAFQAVKDRVDSPNITGTGSASRGNFAKEAAFVYLVTEDPAYAQAAFQRLEEIYTISVPDGHGAPDVGTGLDRAHGVSTFAMTYNWAYDAWTPAQRAWVLGKVNKALDEYESQALSHPNIGFQANNSNWTGVVAGAHVKALIAINQHNVRRFDFQRSRELLRTHLLSFGTRGWTQEGNYYFVLSMEFFMPAMLALRQINDPHVEASFTGRRPHHMTLYAGQFNAGQNSLTWGVGGDSMPAYGMTSALLGLVPEGEQGFYRWFYDRHRGILNPAAPTQKYDQSKAGTLFALISYPEHIPAEDPTGRFPTAIHDSLGGYIIRSGWQDEDDTVVSLWSDTTNHGRSWNQRDALQINILSHGSKWGYGPGPATSGIDAAFSQILVNGVARTESGQGTNIGHQVAPNGGYAMAGGGSKFTNLGLRSAERHVLADFSNADFSIVSTFDRLRSDDIETYGWNLYLPGKSITVGTDPLHDIDYFLTTDSNGSYLKAWFPAHGNGFITGNSAVRYEYDAADADIWVVIATGRGTPPEIEVTGTGLGATVTLGESVLTFDAAAQRIRSSTLTELNNAVNPTLNASPAGGPAPLTVSFSGSGTADPGETLTYHWNFGDGTTSDAQSTAHTFTEEGLYLVSLEVADGRGGTDRVMRHIFVGNREPTARITASATTILPGNPITLSAANSSDPDSDPLTYVWDLGDGRTLTGETIEVSWPTEAVYRVELTATDPAGLMHIARQNIRVENQAPVASFSANTLGGIVPFTVQFDASASFDPEGEAILYRWDFDDGTVVDTTEPLIGHTFTQAKDHTVRLTVFDPAGKSGTTTRTVTALAQGDLLPAEVDTGDLPQGLNYTVYRGDPASGASIPNIATLRPLNSGRSLHFDHDVTDLNQLYVLVLDGYLFAPERGLYSFRLRTQNQARIRVGGVTLVQSSFPHSGTYEGFIALESGFHRYRVEINYAPEFPESTQPLNSILWRTPGEEVYRPIPAGNLSAPMALFQPTFRATPTTVYNGGTVAFEATVVSPDGGPLSYLWDFGDGQTSTEPRVLHTYQLPSNDDHRVYNATLTVTDSTGTAVTVGEQITVSRYAGLVMSPRDRIARNRFAFDQRPAPRDITRAVNHALEPGTQVTFSSEFRPDLGGKMTVDNDYRTRWVSAQPQDWVRFSFTGKDGSPLRYNLTEYSLTSGALGWTTQRDPKDWEVYGSNHPNPAPFSMEPGAANPDWVLLDSVTGRSGEARILPTIYPLPNTEAYAHYLIHMRNQTGGARI